MEFTDYVRARRDELMRFATMLSGQSWLADDLVADVLGRAFERWERIGQVEEPHAYVRRMLVNDYVSWQRRWKRARPVDSVGDIAQAGATVEEAHAAREEILAGLAKLPRQQRAAILCRFYLDWSDAETAQALGCREGTVRSHISRALRSLRIELTTPAPALSDDRWAEPADRTPARAGGLQLPVVPALAPRED